MMSVAFLAKNHQNYADILLVNVPSLDLSGGREISFYSAIYHLLRPTIRFCIACEMKELSVYGALPVRVPKKGLIQR